MAIDNSTMATIVGAIVSLFAALISVIFGVFSYLQNQKAQRAQAEKDVSDAYNRLATFRIKHPEVLCFAREWQPGHFQKVYNQLEKEDHLWVIYYTYAELCIAYCNIVLSTNERGLLDKSSYEQHHKLLVKLLLTENNPIIEDLVNEGKYLSRHIGNFRKNENWNWKVEHELLAK